MVLFLTAFDKQADVREFCCQLNSMEATFDFLSSLVARGDTLLMAYMVEDNKRIDLPLDAFDGSPFLEAMQYLQQEWQSILAPATDVDAVHYKDMLVLLQKRIRQYETSISMHERMINQFSHWLRQMQNSPLTSPGRELFIRTYQRMIDLHRTHLARDRFNSYLVRNRLNQLSSAV